jgi:hypothetical protein
MPITPNKFPKAVASCKNAGSNPSLEPQKTATVCIDIYPIVMHEKGAISLPLRPTI